jgi:hypothetical protein
VRNIANLYAADHLSSVNLKIRVNWIIMKFDGENIIICVCTLALYDYSVFKWIMCIFNLRYILYTHNLLKYWTIVKNQHTNTDNVLTIKIHSRSIHSIFFIYKRYLLNVNFLCYVLVKRKQHMRIWRPLKYNIYRIYILQNLFTSLNSITKHFLVFWMTK